MKACPSCKTYIANDAGFCAKCGRDQSVTSPGDPQQSSNTIQASTSYAPPPPPAQGSPVLAGMGYSLGGCIFISLVVITFMVLGFVGCAVLISAGSAGA